MTGGRPIGLKQGLDSLTKTERLVLRLVADHLGNKEIARIRGTRLGFVREQLKSIYFKLGYINKTGDTSSRLKLALHAFRLKEKGLI